MAMLDLTGRKIDQGRWNAARRPLPALARSARCAPMAVGAVAPLLVLEARKDPAA
jgi:hypothetical protein